MRKTSLIFFLFLLSFTSQAQNLVPNPSFENMVMCPNGVAQLQLASGWISYRESPDYLNICNTNLVSVPSNTFGFQYARSGNAYAGFCTYNTITLYREYAGIQLSQPLIIGQQYFVSFFVSRAFTNVWQINIASNKIGMRFSTIPFSIFSPAPIDNYAQVFTNSIIADTLNWVKVAGSFTADSAYNFLSIGNFFTDAATSIISYSSDAEQSYYYLDDVCVSMDSATCNEIIKEVKEHAQDSTISVFPNPASDLLYITYPLGEASFTSLKVFNSIGQEVKSLVQTENQSAGNHQTAINISGLDAGLYFLKLTTENGNRIQKFMVK